MAPSGPLSRGYVNSGQLGGCETREVIVKGQPFFSAYGDQRSYGFQVLLDKKIGSVIEAIDSGDASLYKPYVWGPE